MGGAPGVWSPTEAIGFGWNALMKNFVGVSLPIAVALFVLVLPVGIVSSLTGFLVRIAIDYVDSSFIQLFNGLVQAAVGGVFIFVNSYIAGGICEFALKVARGQPASFGDVFSGGKYFGAMFVGWIGFSVAVGIGFLLLCVPGYIVEFGLWPFAFVIVDQKLGGIDALKKAWAMTTGHKLSIFVFWLLSILVIIAGELACGIGVLLVSFPVLTLATAHMYLTLKGEPPRLQQ
jgi:uncharacterized membrane protein